MYKISVGLMAALFLVLSGCATVNDDESTYLLPPGSEVQVTRDLNVPDGSRVYIQLGTLVERSTLDIWKPYCFFHMTRAPEQKTTPFVIPSGAYKVTGSRRESNYAGAEGMQFAGKDSNRALSTIIELASDRLEGRTNLVCARWGRPSRDGYLSLTEMRVTLGGAVNLVLAR